MRRILVTGEPGNLGEAGVWIAWGGIREGLYRAQYPRGKRAGRPLMVGVDVSWECTSIYDPADGEEIVPEPPFFLYGPIKGAPE